MEIVLILLLSAIAIALAGYMITKILEGEIVTHIFISVRGGTVDSVRTTLKTPVTVHLIDYDNAACSEVCEREVEKQEAFAKRLQARELL